MGPSLKPSLRLGAAVFVGLCLLPGVVRAHLGSITYLSVDSGVSRVVVEVAVEAIDASMELGLGEEAEESTLLALTDEVENWAAAGITVRTTAGPCLSTTQYQTIETRRSRRYLILEQVHECPDGNRILRDETVFDDDPQHETFVRLMSASPPTTTIFRRNERELDLGETRTLSGQALRFFEEGVIHLVTGYDHVLFLLTLLLGAGTLVKAEGVRSAFRRIALLVTAFTIGHSVTLIIAALGFLSLPAAPVEIMIALSILLVAVLNVVGRGGSAHLTWLTGAFGLVHGLGFSTVLGELGLPTEGTVLALLTFNVGIEVAQLAIVLLLLWPLKLAAERDFYEPWVLRAGSVLVGLLALYWAVERTIGML